MTQTRSRTIAENSRSTCGRPELAQTLSEKGELMLVRFIREEELPALLKLYRFLNPNDPEVVINDALLAEWGKWLSDPTLHYFVLEKDASLVASCMLAIIPNLTRGVRPFGVIQNVVTHPDFRGCGFASELLRSANEFAWSKHCYQVLLQTGRPETHEFYRRAGYRDDVKTGFVAKPEWINR